MLMLLFTLALVNAGVFEKKFTYNATVGYGPSPRDDGFAVGIGDCFFVFGGKKKAGATDEVWKYDTVLETWEELAFGGDTAPHVEDHQMGVLSSTEFFAIGGGGTSGLSADVILFDLVTMNVTIPVVSPQPTPRKDLYGCGLATTRKIYMGGGLDADGTFLDDFWEYDVDSNVWTSLNAPEEVVEDASAACYGTHVFLYGGKTAADIVMEGLHVFDIVVGTWELVPKSDPWPGPLEDHTMMMMGSTLYMYGGGGDDLLEPFYTLDADNYTGGWTEIPYFVDTFPAPVKDHCSAVIGSTFYVFSGESDINGKEDSLWKYKPGVCPLDCSSQGTCAPPQGICVGCNVGYAGAACLRVPEVPAALSNRPSSTEATSNTTSIAVGVSVGVLVCVVLVALVAFLMKKQEAGFDGQFEVDYDEIEVHKSIGIGSFGEVFSGVYRGTDVAVKKLNATELSPAVIAEFRAEVAVMCALRHPNCLLFIGACTKPPHLVMITELMPMGNVYGLLRNEELDLPWGKCMRMCVDATRGMNYLHSASPPILHRDLKSLNLLVDNNWVTKVADFGLTSVKGSVTTGEEIIGSPLWMAPEVLRGEEYTVAADVWSHGVVLWEILTGEELYKDLMSFQVAFRIMSEDMHPGIPDDLMSELKTMLLNTWKPNPKDRLTMNEVMTVFKPFASQNSLNGSSSLMSFSSKKVTPSIQAAAPANDVCFLFTEIPNVEQIWEDLPADTADGLIIYNHCLRKCAAENAGYESSLVEDVFCFVFPSVHNAVMAAVTMQSGLLACAWPEAFAGHQHTRTEVVDDVVIYAGFRVTIGLHFGKTFSQAQEVTGRVQYFGAAVNIASHLCGVTRNGGEILITESVAEQCSGMEIPQESRMEVIGPIRINEFTVPLHRIVIGDLPRPSSTFDTVSTHDTFDEARFEKCGKQAVDRGHIDYALITFGERIGIGSFGELFKCTYEGETVAVKRLLRKNLREELLFDFKSEAVIMKGLHHPNIVNLLGSVVTPCFCFVMEYVPMGDLKTNIEGGIVHSWTWPQRVKFMQSAASGVMYLHSRSPPLIHRDIKSANVLVADKNTAKLCDFGLARVKQSNQTMTKCGSILWTAPEILNGEKYDERCDVYSFAIVMLELLTLKPPYKTDGVVQVPHILKGGRPEIPAKHGAPEAYVNLMTSAWAQAREDRPSFEDIYKALAEI